MLYQDGVGNSRHGNENPDATTDSEDNYYRAFSLLVGQLVTRTRHFARGGFSTRLDFEPSVSYFLI